MSFVQAASDFEIFIKEKVSRFGNRNSSRFDFLHEEERSQVGKLFIYLF
jgi:hypothetical protein